jgi:hypothetical protein
LQLMTSERTAKKATHTKEKTMRRFHWILIALFLTVTVSCGGGSGGGGVTGGGGGSTIYAGSFTPAEPNPGANSVSLMGSASSNIVTLAVNVTGTNDVFGGSFDLVYDPTMAEFANWAAGSLLESGGHQVSYQVNAQQAGRVIVGVSRTTIGAGADAGISTALVQLRLRVIEAGSSSVRIENADLLDSQNPPGPIAGIAFSGGTLSAQ